jgi:hypothetical protein
MTAASRFFAVAALLAALLRPLAAQPTYCNPLNLDYAYKPSRHTYYGMDETHRSTADPAIVRFRGDLYLFSTNQQGYWWTSDMLNWHFVRHSFRINRSNDDVCAPGAWAWGDTMLFMPSHMDSDRMPLYLSTDPKNGIWTQLVDSFPQKHAWDPSFFKDDDGRAYLYWGSSNTFPLYGVELDPGRGYIPKGEALELVRLHPELHGWERFGENHSDTTIRPYTEGAWVTKHAGKYYFQYAAPGTEFNVYADGVYVGEHPLGPFTYQQHNPVSFKPGGFITGAGHGSTFQDAYGNYWHVGTVVSWIKYKFERRLAWWPAGFDADGVMYCNTSFGDYPHYLPQGPRDHRQSSFTGWMMLSYGKAVQASSELPGRPAAHALDENIRSYWSAASADPGEYLQVDLGGPRLLRAIQVNYADEGARLFDKQNSIYHQYRVYASQDGKKWKLLIDKSQSREDSPHDYVPLDRPAKARYLKLENVHMAEGKFAIAGFRVFGKAPGKVPATPGGFKARRQPDERNCRFSWEAVPGAYAYQVYYGTAPDKLYHCILVHGQTEHAFRGLDKGTRYYAAVQALSESGFSPLSAPAEIR